MANIESRVMQVGGGRAWTRCSPTEFRWWSSNCIFTLEHAMSEGEVGSDPGLWCWQPRCVSNRPLGPLSFPHISLPLASVAPCNQDALLFSLASLIWHHHPAVKQGPERSSLSEFYHRWDSRTIGILTPLGFWALKNLTLLELLASKIPTLLLDFSASKVLTLLLEFWAFKTLTLLLEFWACEILTLLLEFWASKILTLLLEFWASEILTQLLEFWASKILTPLDGSTSRWRRGFENFDPQITACYIPPLQKEVFAKKNSSQRVWGLRGSGHHVFCISLLLLALWLWFGEQEFKSWISDFIAI